MSQYQYYEFQALDRPLTADAKEALRAISSRAQITSRSFTNTYNYSDLRGSPKELLAEHFDALVYVSNWGIHQLAFRLPVGVLTSESLAPYALGGGLLVTTILGRLTVEWHSVEEGPDWEDGEEWMPALVDLRDEILRGDMRSLYLGWLAAIEYCEWSGERFADAPTPPVPPGLQALTPAQEALAAFLRLDPCLLEIARAAAPTPAEGPDWDELAAVAARLSNEEKDRWLFRLFEGDEPNLSALFLQRLLREIKKPTVSATFTMTAGDLLAAAQKLDEAKRVEAARLQVEEEARRTREAEVRRAVELDALEAREDEAWAQVEATIAEKNAKAYDSAVRGLSSLYALSIRRGDEEAFHERLRTVIGRFSRRPALLDRLRRADMLL